MQAIIMNKIKKLFQRKVDKPFDKTKPATLLITSLKQNQNYYRDEEIIRQANGIRLDENYEFDKYGWDIKKIIDDLFKENRPEFIFLNYNHHFTHKIKNLNKTGIPIFVFVGDTYNFTVTDERSIRKKDFILNLNPAAYVTAFPNTNDMLKDGLGIRDIKISTCHWAVDENIYYPQNRWRRFDIGCIGAHTAHKYPFRNEVRNHLLSQKKLKFFKKVRVCSHDGFLFAKALNCLKSCFTDSSVYNFTLMKYFEIPACKTLLFGEKTDELESLGFKDGVNFVEVDKNTFPEKFDYYLAGAGKKDYDEIIHNGRELILERHTWNTRIKELLKNIKGHLLK